MLTEYSSKETIVSAKNEPVPAAAEPPESSQNSSFKNKNSVVIEPKHFIASLDLRSLWEYNELFYFLALRDIKIRYKQTLLGIAWVLLQPIITTVIFTTIFLRLGTSQNLSVPYPLFAFSGFTLWIFINSAISNSSNSLINHSNLITKVYFPRLVIPLSSVGATLVDLGFGLISLIIAMFIYGVSPTWQIIFVPLLIVPVIFLALGVGIITAALNVKYRDVKYILPFVLQIFFFMSPIFYSLSMLPEGSVGIWKLNPVTGFVENFRALLFGLEFDWSSFGISVGVSLALFFLSVYIFHWMEDDFADVI